MKTRLQSWFVAYVNVKFYQLRDVAKGFECHGNENNCSAHTPNTRGVSVVLNFGRIHAECNLNNKTS